MKIEELPETVRRLWTFIVPPAVQALLLFLILWFVLGPVRAAQILAGVTNDLSLVPPDSVRDAFEFWKLNDILPFVTLLAALTIAYGVSKVAVLLGDSLPGSLKAEPVRALVRYSSPKKVGDLWERYTYTYDLAGLDQALDNEIEAARDAGNPLIKRAALLHEQYERHGNSLSFIKSAILFVVVVTILSTLMLPSDAAVIWRALWVLVLLLFAALALASARIASYRQYTSSKVDALLAQESPIPSETQLPPNEKQRRRDEVRRLAELGEELSVWSFGLGRSVIRDDLRELRRALLRQRLAPPAKPNHVLPPGVAASSSGSGSKKPE